MVVLVKFSFRFSSYINSQTSVERTADKMESLLTNQEPEFFFKNDHLNHILQINTFYEISVYSKLNVCEDLQFIIQAFSSH